MHPPYGLFLVDSQSSLKGGYSRYPRISQRHQGRANTTEALEALQADASELERIEELIDQFLDEDLPSIEEAVRKEKWIWEPVETDSV